MTATEDLQYLSEAIFEIQFNSQNGIAETVYTGTDPYTVIIDVSGDNAQKAIVHARVVNHPDIASAASIIEKQVFVPGQLILTDVFSLTLTGDGGTANGTIRFFI